jgi:hypothetical protein
MTIATKQAIAIFAVLVCARAYFRLAITPDVQQRIDRSQKYAPNVMHRVQQPPIAPGQGECNNPVVIAAVEKLNKQLPIFTTGSSTWPDGRNHHDGPPIAATPGEG